MLLLKKIYVFYLVVFLVPFYTSAQYADLGVGTLKNQIWWFDWANFHVADGASRTFNLDDGLEVTITFSNVSGRSVTPNNMNTWFGSLLVQSYNFSNLNIKPALLTPTSTSNSNFTINISAKRNGSSVPFSIIASDAESSSPDEQIKLTTTGENWESIEFFRNSSQNSNPLIGCNSKNVTITNTQDVASYPSKLGQNPLVMTKSSNQTISIDVGLLRNVYGASAVAFGILLPIDRGDLPPGYGFAHHQLLYISKNACNYNSPFPELIQDERLKLGAVAGDADAAESLDDNLVGADEEAISVFPDYDGNGSYTLQVPYTNNTGKTAVLTGWFDYNRDGVFSSNEGTSIHLSDNTYSTTLTWKMLPTSFLSNDSAEFAFRFRITTDELSKDNPVGFAPDGEVEDYYVQIKKRCHLSVKTISDTAICVGDTLRLTTDGAVYYKWRPSYGLSDTTISSPLAFPVKNTTYIIEGSDAKGCKSSDTVNLKINQLPELLMSPDTTICLAGAANLWVKGGFQYQWFSIDSSFSKQTDHISVSPEKTTVYYLTVTDDKSCVRNDSVIVFVLEPAQKSLNLMPSAFTPNNDGINDCFGLKNWEQVVKLDFAVYNRFGSKVFSTSNQDDCWDGTYRGKKQPPGAFVYVIKAMTACGIINRKGVVTLIK